MGNRQHGALHASRSAIYMRNPAEDQRTVSNHHWAAGPGTVQTRQRSRELYHGAGYLRACVPVLGVCRAEVCQGEVVGKTLEEGRGREEERTCWDVCTDSRSKYLRSHEGFRYLMSLLYQHCMLDRCFHTARNQTSLCLLRVQGC